MRAEKQTNKQTKQNKENKGKQTSKELLTNTSRRALVL